VHRGSNDGPFLIKVGRKEHSYSPVSELFLSFLKLTPTQAAIKAFADRYGWLGVGSATSGESFTCWQREITDFQDAYTLWMGFEQRPEVCRIEKGWTSPSRKRAAEHVSFAITMSRLSESGYADYTAPRRILLLRAEDERLFEFLKRNPSQPRLPIKAALFQLVNRKLVGNASPCLLLEESGERQAILPRNLLTTLWVQLYQAICGRPRIILCMHCKQPMDVTDRSRSMKAHPKCVNHAKVKKFRRKAGFRGTSKRRHPKP
jgi:hypothetical protein